MSSNASNSATLQSWSSLKGEEIIQELFPSWPAAYFHQRTLDRKKWLVFTKTGGEKTSLFYGPMVIAQYLNEHPVLGFRPSVLLSAKPVALVVVPLIELGNNRVQ